MNADALLQQQQQQLCNTNDHQWHKPTWTLACERTLASTRCWTMVVVVVVVVVGCPSASKVSPHRASRCVHWHWASSVARCIDAPDTPHVARHANSLPPIVRSRLVHLLFVRREHSLSAMQMPSDARRGGDGGLFTTRRTNLSGLSQFCLMTCHQFHPTCFECVFNESRSTITCNVLWLSIDQPDMTFCRNNTAKWSNVRCISLLFPSSHSLHFIYQRNQSKKSSDRLFSLS